MTASVLALILAQAATGAAEAAPREPVAVSATASVRILASRPISFSSAEELAQDHAASAQVSRDDNGTLWLEFT